jgi:hypothetical protein
VSQCATADDFRFVRAWWEVPPERIVRGTVQTSLEEFRRQTFEVRRWVPFAKGGEYSPYYADVHLVVNWECEGAEVKNNLNERGGVRSNVWMLKDTAVHFFFRPGLTWPRRTNSNFGIRALPSGCIFADKGPAAFVSADSLFVSLGLLFSRLYQSLFEIFLAAGDENAVRDAIQKL